MKYIVRKVSFAVFLIEITLALTALAILVGAQDQQLDISSQGQNDNTTNDHSAQSGNDHDAKNNNMNNGMSGAEITPAAGDAGNGKGKGGDDPGGPGTGKGGDNPGKGKGGDDPGGPGTGKGGDDPGKGKSGGDPGNPGNDPGKGNDNPGKGNSDVSGNNSPNDNADTGSDSINSDDPNDSNTAGVDDQNAQPTDNGDQNQQVVPDPTTQANNDPSAGTSCINNGDSATCADPNQFCDVESNICKPKLEKGSQCTNREQCLSGSCVLVSGAQYGTCVNRDNNNNSNNSDNSTKVLVTSVILGVGGAIILLIGGMHIYRNARSVKSKNYRRSVSSISDDDVGQRDWTNTEKIAMEFPNPSQLHDSFSPYAMAQQPQMQRQQQQQQQQQQRQRQRQRQRQITNAYDQSLPISTIHTLSRTDSRSQPRPKLRGMPGAPLSNMPNSNSMLTRNATTRDLSQTTPTPIPRQIPVNATPKMPRTMTSTMTPIMPPITKSATMEDVRWETTPGGTSEVTSGRRTEQMVPFQNQNQYQNQYQSQQNIPWYTNVGRTFTRWSTTSSVLARSSIMTTGSNRWTNSFMGRAFGSQHPDSVESINPSVRESNTLGTFENDRIRRENHGNQKFNHDDGGSSNHVVYHVANDDQAAQFQQNLLYNAKDIYCSSPLSSVADSFLTVPTSYMSPSPRGSTASSQPLVTESVYIDVGVEDLGAQTNQNPSATAGYFKMSSVYSDSASSSDAENEHKPASLRDLNKTQTAEFLLPSSVSKPFGAAARIGTPPTSSSLSATRPGNHTPSALTVPRSPHIPSTPTTPITPVMPSHQIYSGMNLARKTTSASSQDGTSSVRSTSPHISASPPSPRAGLSLRSPQGYLSSPRI